MAKTFYVVVLTESESDGFDRGWLLSPEAKTKAEAQQSIRWQRQAGEDPAQFAICNASDLPGIMERTIDGKARPVLVGKGPYTEDAYKGMILSIWGGGK